MFYDPLRLEAVAHQYCYANNTKLGKFLGKGIQGMVFSTLKPSALKIHHNETSYQLERDVYRRLFSFAVKKVDNFSVPALINFSDQLFAIEMSIVTPPYVLDFGGAYLDKPASYMSDPYKVNEWLKENQEVFGDDWPIAHAVIKKFQVDFGIFISDVNRGNIRL
jgi:hypothetical protein